jgi:hypothetical protein
MSLIRQWFHFTNTPGDPVVIRNPVLPLSGIKIYNALFCEWIQVHFNPCTVVVLHAF